MNNKEELLNNKDFYKTFKTGEDLTSFFKQMHKRAVEHILSRILSVFLFGTPYNKSIKGGV
ncbi:MAG: hypothetical protein IPL35_06000 [Sphingobacteriales bacterium]|nr:hypothetical protein [Sphingobacteriales bacterium]